MSTSYKIKDVADRSGFTAATLRYYEEIGLLPEASCTPAGYQLHDDRPLDELTRLVAAEQDCCQFFNFAITVDTRGIALEVRSPADALPVLQSLFGGPA